jgi:hypothetical protein
MCPVCRVIRFDATRLRPLWTCGQPRPAPAHRALRANNNRGGQLMCYERPDNSDCYRQSNRDIASGWSRHAFWGAVARRAHQCPARASPDQA